MIEALFQCPDCERELRVDDVATTDRSCPCGWNSQVTEAIAEERIRACPVCGCEDLYLQKDFPHRVGIALVVGGVVLSTIAWSYHSWIGTFGILFLFGAIDWIFFHTRPDVTVCYRCLGQFRNMSENPAHRAFDLGVGERYRQERLRREELRATEGSNR